MIFTLEATNAAAGDGLILHYGDEDDRRLMLIDGGPTGNYARRLKARIEALRDELAPGDSLPVELLMVSHIDDDHVAGVLDLVKSCVRAEEASETPLCQFERIWHNSFGGLLSKDAAEVASTVDPSEVGAAPEVEAVIASVGQGAELQDAAVTLTAELNDGRGVVSAPESGVLKVDVEGVSLTVVAPLQKQIDNLRKLWATELEKRRKKEGAAEVSAYLDTTVPNLSSIVVLAECDGRRMLLTGDARGDHVLNGLQQAGLLGPGTDSMLELDVLKVPHHGSDRNVATDFFRRLPAKHYVISADGKHGNPENATLLMIVEGRGGVDGYTIHMTNRDGAEGLGDRLTELIEKQEQGGQPLPLSFREQDHPSLFVDLIDPVPR